MARELKLGLNTGYWTGGPPPGMAETVVEAEHEPPTRQVVHGHRRHGRRRRLAR